MATKHGHAQGAATDRSTRSARVYSAQQDGNRFRLQQCRVRATLDSLVADEHADLRLVTSL